MDFFINHDFILLLGLVSYYLLTISFQFEIKQLRSYHISFGMSVTNVNLCFIFTVLLFIQRHLVDHVDIPVITFYASRLVISPA